jgi:small subunit ribosomal protein S20
MRSRYSPGATPGRLKFGIEEEIMPNTKSASKRLRQNKVARVRNRAIKSDVRTQLRKVDEAVKAGDIGKAENEFQVAAKKLDKAAGKKTMHRNTVARLKSRLQKRIKGAKESGD